MDYISGLVCDATGQVCVEHGKISDFRRRPGCLACSSLLIGLPKRLRLAREGQTAQISTETRGHLGNVGLSLFGANG